MHNWGTERTLRAHLQARTRDMHDRLDRSVSSGEMVSRDNYARFLTSQLRAREPIEEWADRQCPALLRPPSMTSLIRADLAELAPEPSASIVPPALVPAAPFTLPAGADPIGLAWAIAGSQLGNRAILVRMRKAAPADGGARRPSRFLADARMTGFWHRLLPRLQQAMDEEEAAPAIAAATAVFACFEQAFADGADDAARSRRAA